MLVHRTDAQLSSEEPYRLVVWNPVTGDQELLPLPPRDYQFFAGAILCGSPDCNHVSCASLLVVFVGCDEDEDDKDQNVVWESSYSSATGEWSSLVELQRPRGDYRTYQVEMVPPLLINGALYFTFDSDEENEEDFLKYHLEERKLSLINRVPVDYYGGGAGVVITSAEGGLGVVTTEDSDLNLWSWRENTNEPPQWILSEQIRLVDTIIPFQPGSLSLRSSIDGTSIVFIDNGRSLFTLDIATLEAKEVGDSIGDSVIPLMSYVMPRGQGKNQIYACLFYMSMTHVC